MKERKVNINNVFYGVVGVATLMVAVMGATFAYFTATANNATTIKGNMATINFDVSVAKVTDADDQKGGLIPMSNNMMEQALTKNVADASRGICIDDNGNAVCQVYKITVNNTSSSSMFVDGYVTLRDGSGAVNANDVPAGFTYATGTATTMRWAQAFCTTEANGLVSGCSTANGTGGAYSTLRTDSGKTSISFGSLGGESTKADGRNTAEMEYVYNNVKGTTVINGNEYEVINKNYIRLSGRAKGDTAYKKNTDVSSALVFNQFLNANDGNTANDTGTSSSTFTDSQVYYIVVWLTENGLDQTAVTGASGAATKTDSFFEGNVTFVTAQGSEVTATFTGLKKVSAIQ